MSEQEQQVMAYRAVCKHAKVRVLMVDDPRDDKRVTAKRVADCIRRGLIIEHVTVEEARKSDMVCPACDEERKAKRKNSKA